MLTLIHSEIGQMLSRLTFRTLVVLLVYCSIGAHSAPGQERGTGLNFAPANVLEGIPLAHTPFAGADLPSKVDLSDRMPPPGNQGRQNSCVAWSVAYALKSYQEHIEEKKPLQQAGLPDLEAVFSPAFVYNQINHGQDNGSFFVDALNLLSQTGAVKWADMPYDASNWTKQPTADLIAKGKKYRIDIWRRVNVRDTKEVKAQLQMTYPVIIGAEVYPNFVNHQGGVFTSPQGQAQGGHAMIVVGYDDSKSAFKVQNSWGTGWGDGGFGWISYTCFSQIVREGYVAMDATNGNGPLVRDVTPKDTDQPLPSPSVQPVQPQPDAKVAVDIANIQHNIFHPALGPCMQINGMLVIPPGHPGTAQVVVPVFQPGDADGTTTGPPVSSRMPMFATVQGQMATSPGVIQISQMGAAIPWQAFLPYSAANLPAGFEIGQPFPITHKLLIKATVYINNFGVGEGSLFKITITK